MIRISNCWEDYELLETGNQEKTERWGNIILRRPDPQCIWPYTGKQSMVIHGLYTRSDTGGGSWEWYKNIPGRWQIAYRDLKFWIEPTGFKHTGLFPEQAVNWDFLIDKIKGEISNTKKPVSVLNLFAYTGGATVACAYAGASVCHVDASKGMVTRAKENAQLSGLANAKIRYIVDDVVKFVKREINRNNKYDVIIMDPPSYGRGPKGEMWQIEDSLYSLVGLCSSVLSDDPLAFLVNSYASDISMTAVKNVLDLTVGKKYGGSTECYELGLQQSGNNLVMPCGYTARWEKK